MKTKSNGHTLTLFTQTTILREIGYTRLAKSLDLFKEELSPELLSLLTRLTSLSEVTTYRDTLNSTPSPEIVELAASFADFSVLPERLRAALFTLEAAASPENQTRLDAIVQRLIPSVALSQRPLDRALEIWFLVPDELAPFAPLAAPAALNEIPSPIENHPAPGGSKLKNGEAQHPDPDALAFERLARLSPAEYDRARKAEARLLRMRIETLDTQVAEYRAELDLQDQANAVKLPAIELWPEPVDGATTLNEVSSRFSLYLFLPPGAADAMTLWETHTHAFAAFHLSPRLNLHSPKEGCGKTTAFDVLTTMAARPLRTENISAPVLFRLVDQHQPTLLLDEVDAYIHQSEELRGLLNAGHKRGACAYRCEGEGKAVRAFNAFAPAALAGIGSLPATLRDRSILIPLVAAEEGQLTTAFDQLHTEVEDILARKLARWARDNFPALAAYKPVLPPGAFNRLADNWRPLFAIAQVAGADWPARALAAFEALASRSAFRTPHSELRTDSSNPQPSTFNPQLSLLSDIRQIFTQTGTMRISSKQLVAALCALPGPDRYSALRTHGQSGSDRSALNRLARRLSQFGIKPCTMRIGKRLAKGYDVVDFTPVFARLLRDGLPNGNGDTPSH